MWIEKILKDSIVEIKSVKGIKFQFPEIKLIEFYLFNEHDRVIFIIFREGKETLLLMDLCAQL